MLADEVLLANTAALKRQGIGWILDQRDPRRKQGAQDYSLFTEKQGVLMVMKPRPGLSVLHSIHMFGVPFEIAAAWLNPSGEILDLKRAQPGRIYFPSGLFTETTHILEVHPVHLPLLKKAERVTWEFPDA